MMKQVPFLLVYSRIVMALLIGGIAWSGVNNATVLMVTLMTLGLITDVLDGIIARRVGVATEKLRVWDSNVDQFFWIVVLVSVFGLNIHFIKQHYLPVVGIVLLEALAYLICFLKFKRSIATHSYLAKLWTLTLLAFLIDLTLHGQSHSLFVVCAVMGIISRIEIILIIVVLKKWASDVPSLLSVGSINRQG